ncbi:MAG: molybdopterin-dependent oxidoreductase [Candidatus Binataceae bacterium]|jgi:molybdopterin-containing oxidoreductase family iron-sulfur binding subunit
MSDGLSRRSFLKLAATASAAAAIPGCEPAARKLIPYVVPDENVIPGVPTFYATTCAECSAGCGIVARVMEGRVIKLEGNPIDPISQGAICARGQAALQGLYNPDRLGKPNTRVADGTLTAVSWDDATKLINDKLAAAAKAGKDRVAFIGSSQGPTLDKVTRTWAQAFNSSRVGFWEAFSDEPARAAAEACFGRRDLPIYKLDQAETIISFGADFVETWGSPVEYARQFAQFRAPKVRKGNLSIGNAAYVGPRLNSTAAKCDEWVASNAGTEGAVAMAVLNVVVNQGWVASDAGGDAAALKTLVADYDPDKISTQTGVSADQIKKIASWFGQATDGAVALAGTSDPQAHLAALILNAITGNVGKTVVFLNEPPAQPTSRPEEIKAIIDAMRDGQIDVLVIAGGNPAYSMPPGYAFKEASKRVGYVIWMGEVPDESADLANLLIPTHHALESWRDTAPRPGIFGLGQPVMQPVYPSRPLHDILIASAHLGGGTSAQAIPYENAADAINTSWQELQGKIGGSTTPKKFWDDARRHGGVFQDAKAAGALKLNSAALQSKSQPPAAPAALTLWAFPHIFLYDGRGANKSWLQEIPDPVTQIVWDTWAEMHPETAAKLGLKQDYEQTRLYAGINVIEIATPGGPIELTVTISRLVKPGVIAVPFGQGHSSYGRSAKGIGVNPFSFLPEGTRSVSVTARKLDKTYKLVTPLGNSDMLGRTIIEAMSVSDLAKGVEPDYGEEKVERPYEMYAPFEYPGHKWGMTIDVNSCTGCSACIAACYAENNIQVVGKDNVDLGRIMSWIRVERYIQPEDKPGAGPLVQIAPMLCQQCDHAPCEPVCPVFASSHTNEGLNAQIYNRCIGTRFCENNCPYKVRRFNWYAPEFVEPLNYQLNPDVTVRGAGVMEKCTFCIQRITTAEINARTEDRKLLDGEIITACAQACPSRAITFGDINDPNSAMIKRRNDNKGRTYTMLPEFNALPAVTYLRDLYQEKGKA